MPLRKQGTFSKSLIRAAAVALLASASAPAVSLAASCQAAPSTQAFARFGDTSYYSLAPGGDFEKGSPGWTLKNGAVALPGNDATFVAPGSQSLTLPQGGVAISPEFCVDETHPTFRFMERALGPGSSLQALVVYRDSAGQLTQATFQASISIASTPLWIPSISNPLATKIPLIVGGNTATVQLYFVSTRGGWSIDNVMVDPYRRG